MVYYMIDSKYMSVRKETRNKKIYMLYTQKNLKWSIPQLARSYGINEARIRQIINAERKRIAENL